MKKLTSPALTAYVHLTSLVFALFLSINAWANDEPSPSIPESAVKLSITEPDRSVGFMMGDLLNRSVTLEVKKPYKLVETTLPIVGYEHRYKGQVSGIELRKISHTRKENRNSTTYTIDLTYQVFTTAPVVKPAILPAEIIKFQGPKTAEAKDGLVQYRVPSFYFRISPMVVFGAVKIEQDMSPFRKPFLLQPYPEKQRLIACLIVLGLSLLGLLYILGTRAWLPLMGKPFAQAVRQLRKLKTSNEANLKLAIGCVHHRVLLQTMETGTGCATVEKSEGVHRRQTAHHSVTGSGLQYEQQSHWIGCHAHGRTDKKRSERQLWRKEVLASTGNQYEC